MAPDWCHSGGMDLTQYVENLRARARRRRRAGGEDARALAERLTAALESAIRLMLLDALSAAADEITRELAPGSVELRLRGGEPGFVVTPAAGRRGRPSRSGARAAGAAGRRRRRRRRASTCACRSSSRPASSRPPPASGCRSTRGSSAPPPRRSRTTIAARGSAAGASARPSPAGCAERRPIPSTTPSSNLTQEGIPMPTFDTPTPISATIDLGLGDVRITAGDRATTVVDVRPSDPSNDGDSRAASDPDRPRGRPAARQGAEAAPVAAPQRRRLDRRHRRAARRLEHQRHRRIRGLPLRRPARHVPDQDRPRHDRGG